MARSPRLILQTSAQGSIGEIYIYVRKKGRQRVGGTLMPMRGVGTTLHPAIRVNIFYEITLFVSSLEESWPDCIAIELKKVETDNSGFHEVTLNHWVSRDQGTSFEHQKPFNTEDLKSKQTLKFI